MPPAKVLVGTHAVVFLVGVVLGQQLNADELSMYRDAHEGAFSRWKRKAVSITLGVASLSTVIMVVRAARHD